LAGGAGVGAGAGVDSAGGGAGACWFIAACRCVEVQDFCTISPVTGGTMGSFSLAMDISFGVFDYDFRGGAAGGVFGGGISPLACSSASTALRFGPRSSISLTCAIVALSFATNGLEVGLSAIFLPLLRLDGRPALEHLLW
jgi:hypothetical protein